MIRLHGVDTYAPFGDKRANTPSYIVGISHPQTRDMWRASTQPYLVCRGEGVELGCVVGLNEADHDAEGDRDEADVLPRHVFQAQGTADHPNLTIIQDGS